MHGDPGNHVALLIEFEDGSKHWVPKGQMLQPDTELSAVGDRGRLVVSSWFATHARLFAAGQPEGVTTSSRPPRKSLENRENSGVLFPQRAQGQQPNWRGGIRIDDTEFKIAAWGKTSKKGREYLSLAIEPLAPPDAAGPSDDDIPF